MARQKLTPWFPASVAPERQGLYECNRLEGAGKRVTRMLLWVGPSPYFDWKYTDDGVFGGGNPGDPALMLSCDDDRWRGIQGDEHSVQRGESLCEVDFGNDDDGAGKYAGCDD